LLLLKGHGDEIDQSSRVGWTSPLGSNSPAVFFGCERRLERLRSAIQAAQAVGVEEIRAYPGRMSDAHRGEFGDVRA